MDSDLLSSIRNQLLAFPEPSKEVEDLTNQEHIALCIASGCEMDYRMENNNGSYRMVAATVHPVGIIKTGDKFVVYQMVSSDRRDA